MNKLITKEKIRDILFQVGREFLIHANYKNVENFFKSKTLDEYRKEVKNLPSSVSTCSYYTISSARHAQALVENMNSFKKVCKCDILFEKLSKEEISDMFLLFQKMRFTNGISGMLIHGFVPIQYLFSMKNKKLIRRVLERTDRYTLMPLLDISEERATLVSKRNTIDISRALEERPNVAAGNNDVYNCYRVIRDIYRCDFKEFIAPKLLSSIKKLSLKNKKLLMDALSDECICTYFAFKDSVNPFAEVGSSKLKYKSFKRTLFNAPDLNVVCEDKEWLKENLTEFAYTNIILDTLVRKSVHENTLKSAEEELSTLSIDYKKIIYMKIMKSGTPELLYFLREDKDLFNSCVKALKNNIIIKPLVRFYNGSFPYISKVWEWTELTEDLKSIFSFNPFLKIYLGESLNENECEALLDVNSSYIDLVPKKYRTLSLLINTITIHPHFINTLSIEQIDKLLSVRSDLRVFLSDIKYDELTSIHPEYQVLKYLRMQGDTEVKDINIKLSDLIRGFENKVFDMHNITAYYIFCKRIPEYLVVKRVLDIYLSKRDARVVL